MTAFVGGKTFFRLLNFAADESFVSFSLLGTDSLLMALQSIVWTTRLVALFTPVWIHSCLSCANDAPSPEN